jgi:thymidylate kinase
MNEVEMKPKHVFISLDGVDGVGKTTVAKILAADGCFQYHKSPSGPFAQLRKEVDAHATPLERYCFYRLATQFDSAQISQFLEINSVICDRYIASTLAYHIAMDPRIRVIHTDTGLLKPHFAFLLGARSEIRERRILERAKVSSDVKLERDSAFLDCVAEIFMSFGLIYIDTSDITAEDAATTIKRISMYGEMP